LSTSSCRCVSAPRASSMMHLATRFSLDSTRLRFSSSRTAACLLFASITLFLSSFIASKNSSTVGKRFKSSILHSASGPVCTEVSSFAFFSRYTLQFLVASCISWMTPATFFSLAANGEYASRYGVPWLPAMVT